MDEFYTGTTPTGFNFKIKAAVFESMEFIEALNDMHEHFYKSGEFASLLFGEEQKKALYEHIKKTYKTEFVNQKDFENEITAIFGFCENAKNS